MPRKPILNASGQERRVYPMNGFSIFSECPCCGQNIYISLKLDSEWVGSMVCCEIYKYIYQKFVAPPPIFEVEGMNLVLAYYEKKAHITASK
eukprot:snap_masked-scaffold_11-processed-gene-12.61-mRNA-1 protein AED:1.00 eAED:1.00 QI:0/0/0/0/1/1/3/0/91